MPTIVNIHEAKTHLSNLLVRVADGEEIIIAKAGRPIAVLSAIQSAPEPRTPGGDAGTVIISADFDAPLDEFDL
jgi:prevent-host-death family protein